MNLIAIFIFFTKSFELGFAIFMGSWCIRQLGHFFFESKEFDVKANMSFEQKESEKVGANLERKRYMIVGLILAFVGFAFSPHILVQFANTLGHHTDSAFSALMFFSMIVFLMAWVLRSLWLAIFHSPVRVYHGF